jgi:MaoC like domain
MQTTHSLEFAAPPAAWSTYPKILLGRKPSLVKEGSSVPRIEAHLKKVRISQSHLASYIDMCGAPKGATLPIAYPHILASPLHLAMLGAPAFPVKLLGLVHVRNRIAQRRPIEGAESGDLFAWIEGHRETARGQEFELNTEYRIDGEKVWDETCTFLARQRAMPTADSDAKSSQTSTTLEVLKPFSAMKTSSFRVEAGLGRRYGWISGDFNPIHLADVTAKTFGFKGAIAHGMWSMARCASEFEPEQFCRPVELTASFKLPIFMPAWVMLERWAAGNGFEFCLRDTQGDKPHLTGALRPLGP